MSNIYTIIGTEEILVSKRIKEIKDKYNTYSQSDLLIDLEENSIITLLEELFTIPLFEDIKIITLVHPLFIYDKAKADSRLIDDFIRFLSSKSDNTVLIVVLEKDMDNFVAKTLKENSTVSYISKLEIDDLKTYVNDIFTNDGFSINKRAIEELVSRVDHDILRVLIEVEKLKTFKNEEKTIDYNDVILLVSKDLDDNIYNLVEAVLNKNKIRIGQIYSDLMTLNVDETFIISSLVSKFNEMYQTKVLLEAGNKKDSIAKIFNVKPGRAYYMIQNASLFNLKSIKDNINELIKIDYNIKTGKIDKKLALEIYLLLI